MAIIGFVLWWVLRIYSLVLVARIVLDWVRAYNPSWQPRRAILVAAGIIYSLTDWALRLVRRLVPPLRLGPIALDLGAILLFIAIGFLQNLVALFLR